MCADRAGCIVEVGFGRRPFWCIVRAWTSIRGKPPQIKMPPGACFLYSEAGTHLAMALKPGETPCHRARSGRLFPSQSGRLRGALASTLKSPAEVKYGCHWRVRSLPQFPTAVGLQAAPRIARLLPRTRRGRQPTVPGCRNQPTPHRGPTRSTWLHQG
jgi:hypothetical protein